MKKFLPSKLTELLHTSKKLELPDDHQELKPKHVVAIINKRKHCAISWC
jgi:hypothetical protein